MVIHTNSIDDKVDGCKTGVKKKVSGYSIASTAYKMGIRNRDGRIFSVPSSVPPKSYLTQEMIREAFRERKCTNYAKF